jgi:dTDP-4-dehydrorhamnose reductase
MQTLLILGRTGQVARELSRLSEGYGYRAVALGRPDADIETLDFDAQIAASGATLMVNAAAYTAVDRAEQEAEAALSLNAKAPGHAARACAAAGIPFVHISTDYVFDGAKAEPYLESDPTNPVGVYGKSKTAGEAAVAEAGGDWAIVRTAWVYSPFGANFVKTMLRLAESREEVGVVADQIGCPTAAADVATACLKLGSLLGRKAIAPREIWHAAGEGEASWAAFAEAIFAESAALQGPSARVRRISTAEYPTPAARPANSRLDCEKLLQATGWRPGPWRSSLTACLRELMAQHPA